MYPCVWECVDVSMWASVYVCMCVCVCGWVGVGVSMWASVSVGVAACVGYLCVGVHAFM